jgi:hypothetical protein
MDELLQKLLTVDTLINVCVFVFIGLMLWLYVKADPGGDPDKRSD